VINAIGFNTVLLATLLRKARNPVLVMLCQPSRSTLIFVEKIHTPRLAALSGRAKPPEELAVIGIAWIAPPD
jgi:hypothetical protein